MPVASTDLVLYAAANMPDDDVSTVGGAIDLLRFIDFTQIAANDTIEAVSDNAGDTQNLTIEGRNAAGQIVSETKQMTGVTPISFGTLGTVERVLKAELASNSVGIITVRRATGPVTIRTIPAVKRGFMALFRKTASSPGGSSDYYMKAFWKNEHGTLALTTAQVKQNADPDSRITHTLATNKDDSVSTANRITVPGAGDIEPDTFADIDVNVPSGDLDAGEAIGVWFELTLPMDDAPHNTTYTSELAGNSV
jgi:hypothetical protein